MINFILASVIKFNMDSLVMKMIYDISYVFCLELRDKLTKAACIGALITWLQWLQCICLKKDWCVHNAESGRR